jgi:hypothetical protein
VSLTVVVGASGVWTHYFPHRCWSRKDDKSVSLPFSDFVEPQQPNRERKGYLAAGLGPHSSVRSSFDSEDM